MKKAVKCQEHFGIAAKFTERNLCEGRTQQYNNNDNDNDDHRTIYAWEGGQLPYIKGGMLVISFRD